MVAAASAAARLTAAALVALALLAGCSARTVSPEEAARQEAEYQQSAASWGNGGKAATATPRPPDYVVTPIYAASIDVVQSAVVSACLDRFGAVDRDDRAAHVVEAGASTAWAGSSHVVLTLTEHDGKTVVDMVSESGDSGGRPRRDLRELAGKIQLEMNRIDTQRRADASR